MKTLVSPEHERERERVDAEEKKNHTYTCTHTHSTYTHTSVLETVLHTQEKFTREEALERLGWTRFSTRCSM